MKLLWRFGEALRPLRSWPGTGSGMASGKTLLFLGFLHPRRACASVFTWSCSTSKAFLADAAVYDAVQQLCTRSLRAKPSSS